MSRPACKIEGCDNQSAGRGWCHKHWLRWRKHGDPNVVLPKRRPRKYPPVCSVDGCEGKHHAHGYCSRHATRFTKLGDPLAPPRKPTGRPPVDGVPGYDAAHKRISRALGPASRFVCVQCSEPAHEWSYDGGDPDELTTSDSPRDEHPGLAYSLNPDYYSPRCRPCHHRRDLSLVRPRDAAGRFTTIDYLEHAPRTERTHP